MPFQREHIHVYATTTDGVHHAMLVGDTAAPFALKIALQRFRFAHSAKRMLLDILQKCGNAIHNLLVTGPFPVVSVFLGLLKQYYFHKSSMAMGSTLQCPPIQLWASRPVSARQCA